MPFLAGWLVSFHVTGFQVPARLAGLEFSFPKPQHFFEVTNLTTTIDSATKRRERSWCLLRITQGLLTMELMN
jgi:hypothetical protein